MARGGLSTGPLPETSRSLVCKEGGGGAQYYRGSDAMMGICFHTRLHRVIAHVPVPFPGWKWTESKEEFDASRSPSRRWGLRAAALLVWLGSRLVALHSHLDLHRPHFRHLQPLALQRAIKPRRMCTLASINPEQGKWSGIQERPILAVLPFSLVNLGE